MDEIAPFTFDSPSPRVLFGAGTAAQTPNELRRLNLSRPLICSAPSPSGVSMARRIHSILATAGLADCLIASEALVHNPAHVIEKVLPEAASRDCLISIGGGSAIGLAKAIALRTGLPHLCLPTTYSGSETTASVGETRDGKKRTVTDEKVRPRVVLYDVDLTMGVPPEVSAASGVNALAHSFEALYAQQSNPISTLLALGSIEALWPSLPVIAAGKATTGDRSQALYGAYLAGAAVSATGIALHHKLAHAVGGTLNFPHAETHAILLPHSIAYNIKVLHESTLGRLAKVLVQDHRLGGNASIDVVVECLNRLVRQLAIPTGLKDLGMEMSDIDRVVSVLMERPFWNPRPIVRKAMVEIVRRAWAGEEAKTDL